jgi:hypothetical protein
LSETKRVIKAQSAGSPFSVSRGDIVKVHPRSQRECLGWAWCEKGDGKFGWIPDAYLSRREEGYLITMDFSSRELEAEAGRSVMVVFENLGRTLCRLSSGEEGWLPTGNLE